MWFETLPDSDWLTTVTLIGAQDTDLSQLVSPIQPIMVDYLLNHERRCKR